MGRKFTLRHFQALERKLREEESLVKDRLGAEELRTMHNAGLASIVFDPGETFIIACCFLRPTRLEDVLELSTLWVHPDFRQNVYAGKSLSESVLARCTHIARALGLKAIMFTRLGCVAELALKCGWLEDACGACHMVRTLIRPNPPHPASARQDPLTRFFCSW